MSSEAIRSATSSAPRGARLVQGFRARGCDAALLIGAGHAAHLLGYQRVYSGPVAQLIDAEGHTTLIVPVYEVEAARACTGVEDVHGYGEPGFGLDLAIVDKLVSLASALVPRGRLAVERAPGRGGGDHGGCGRRVRADRRSRARRAADQGRRGAAAHRARVRARAPRAGRGRGRRRSPVRGRSSCMPRRRPRPTSRRVRSPTSGPTS